MENVSSALFLVCGIPDDKLVEAHGSFATASCHLCYTPFPADEAKVKSNNVCSTRAIIIMTTCILCPFAIFVSESHHEWQCPHMHVLFRHSQAECCVFRRGSTWKIFPTWNRLPQSRPAHHHGHFSKGQLYIITNLQEEFELIMVAINTVSAFSLYTHG